MLRSFKKLTGALCLFACASILSAPLAMASGGDAETDPIIRFFVGDRQSDKTSSGTGAKTSAKATGKRTASDRKSNYAKLIRKAAAKHGVPVKIAKAVVEVESNFNPRARGRAGEVGLMQIKPATARGIGYRGSTKALYDPATNLEWGMKYLAGAHKRANGDLCGTILRYNAGHYAKRMNPVSRRYCTKVKQIMASS
ncbi:lytic transglycosylase domain-containing protein [Roseibium aggregatum]|uniref:lytic transglycosylase domain-containing protein n=1 Tax=Roseibium aggregatum TaxID=187304 RepID=UPI001F3236DC|nr:transglycosylase SLT domain-containing protein [Roseibium aggregatum]